MGRERGDAHARRRQRSVPPAQHEPGGGRAGAPGRGVVHRHAVHGGRAPRGSRDVRAPRERRRGDPLRLAARRRLDGGQVPARHAAPEERDREHVRGLERLPGRHALRHGGQILPRCDAARGAERPRPLERARSGDEVPEARGQPEALLDGAEPDVRHPPVGGERAEARRHVHRDEGPPVGGAQGGDLVERPRAARARLVVRDGDELRVGRDLRRPPVGGLVPGARLAQRLASGGGGGRGEALGERAPDEVERARGHQVAHDDVHGRRRRRLEQDRMVGGDRHRTPQGVRRARDDRPHGVAAVGRREQPRAGDLVQIGEHVGRHLRRPGVERHAHGGGARAGALRRGRGHGSSPPPGAARAGGPCRPCRPRRAPRSPRRRASAGAARGCSRRGRRSRR